MKKILIINLWELLLSKKKIHYFWENIINLEKIQTDKYTKIHTDKQTGGQTDEQTDVDEVEKVSPQIDLRFLIKKSIKIQAQFQSFLDTH